MAGVPLLALWIGDILRSRPSSSQAWFGAAVGLTLAGFAVYEHFRRREKAQAMGTVLGALGLFLWAGYQWPFWVLLGVIVVAVLTPLSVFRWRVVERVAAHSPVKIVRVHREPTAPVPMGERGLCDFRRDGDRALGTMTALLNKMSREGT
jgi:hypothetical protein